MAAGAGDENLSDSTWGKLILLLCKGPRTVNELMAALAVTDNAVRAQLAGLQRSGLVRPAGLRPGTRKPHVEYELTPRARSLFPRAHEPVLRALVDVLRERLPAQQTDALMREVARRVLAALVGDLREREPDRRAAELYERVAGVAPGLSLTERPDHLEVRACGCPLASVTAAHPQVCDVLARVLGEALGATVRERCDRGEAPRCRFEIVRVDAR